MAVVSELSINHSSCRYHYDGIPYDSDSFVVTHSASYTLEWTTGTHFTYNKVGYTITVTANGTNSSGSPYEDYLTITQGALTVIFTVIQFISPM
jgi:hypothetical protein